MKPSHRSKALHVLYVVATGIYSGTTLADGNI